jgi:hypothetical protein
MALRPSRIRRGPLGLGRERGQDVIPVRLQLSPQDGEAGGVDAVQTPRAVRPVGDETCSLKDAQVLGDRRPADRQLAGDLPDRQGPATERAEMARLVGSPSASSTASGVSRARSSGCW